MSVTTLEYVEAPPTTPLPYGLLSTAQVVDHPDGDGEWRFGVQWEPPGCASVGDAEGVCAAATGLTADPNGTTGVTIAPASGAYLPAGSYTIDWGADAPEVVTSDDLNDGKAHTYGAGGVYTITVTGPNGYVATTSVDTQVNTAAAAFTSSSTTYVTQDGIGLVTGLPFVAYAELRCRPVGRDDLADRAREAMRLRTPYAVEVVTGRRLEAATSTLMSGGSLHPVDAVGALEQYAGSVYGGVPVLHMGRRTAETLFSYGVLRHNNGRLETGLGSLVAAGAGYHTLRRGGADAASGTGIVYATGAVRVDRPIAPQVIGPLLARDPDTGGRLNDITVRAQAEHVVSWECFTAAAVVTLPYREPAS